jgi:hypothetical protein
MIIVIGIFIFVEPDEFTTDAKHEKGSTRHVQFEIFRRDDEDEPQNKIQIKTEKQECTSTVHLNRTPPIPIPKPYTLNQHNQNHHIEHRPDSRSYRRWLNA